MSNGDEAMSPAEFAKLMGAYPEPVGNPLPAYGGYMDNSPANFAWVQNNDYFGAEVHIDGSPRIHGHTKCDCDRCERGREGFYPHGWTCEYTGVVYRYKDAEYHFKNHAVTYVEANDEDEAWDIFSGIDPAEDWEIEDMSADTDLTPTNHMNNSIGQVVPITNPMELPTNLIETEAGGGPEGQITPDTFEAPYGGLGAIMDIGKSTPLADFTDEELTTSSAIHGDFDQASLNYSGHQNLEVRAESEEELYDCVSCGEPAVSMTLDECLDCGQQYNAEFEDLTENLVEVVNVLGEGVARIRIEDTEYDEDENIVTEDVDIEITDMDGNTLHEQTLDDSWSPYDDRDDYLESEMVETAKKHPMALLLGGLFGATVILKPEIFQPVTNTISSIFEGVKANFNSDTQEVLENDPELVENPDTGDLDPAQYEELVVESTGLALDVIPMSLDPSFMGSRFAALPTERYVEYNDPGIGAHTDIAMNRDEKFLEPEMAMVQAAEEGNEVKEAQAPGQSPYMSVDGQEPKDFNYRVIHETSPISLDPAVKPFIPQSMAGYTGNANTPPSVLNKMFNIGVLGQTPLFVAGQGDIGSSHTGSRNALPNSLGIAGSVGGPLSDKVNANYTDGTTSMSLAQWAIENTVSQSSDTEAIVIDRSSGAMKRVRRV